MTEVDYLHAYNNHKNDLKYLLWGILSIFCRVIEAGREFSFEANRKQALYCITYEETANK